MKIEHEALLIRRIKEGVNLFLGAGFSLHSYDGNKKKLPLASELCTELINEFKCAHNDDLSKVCTIIDSFNRQGLKEYLVKRFDVESFEPFYKYIMDVNCMRVFTTNIDNLVQKIFEENNQKYINNVFINGACPKNDNCIEYIPIHGCVNMPDLKFLFNKQEVANSFTNRSSSWHHLSRSAGQYPCIFLGYSMGDNAALESLQVVLNEGINVQKEKWILLYKEDKGQEDYFRALGFKIIIGGVKDFLLFVKKLQIEPLMKVAEGVKDNITEIYPKSVVPKNNQALRVRQIDEFFLGAPPIWSDILSNRIYAISHLDNISNLIESIDRLVVSGIPASGKSTLMLQLAKKYSLTDRVLLFQDLSNSKASIIRNEIKSPAIVLVDNFSSQIDSFLILSKNPYIKLIGFDRYYNIDIVSHMLPEPTFKYYDISDLTPQDIQGIFDTIPLSIRKNKLVSRRKDDEVPSVFEIVNYNINKPALKERYKDALTDLDDSDPLLLELLIMTCYLYSCRVPVSFEVANAFLYDETDSYEDVLDIMGSMKGMINDIFNGFGNEFSDEQDYYQPRSQVLAETIISQTNSSTYGRVFDKFHKHVPKHLIPNYDVFKKYGYDSYYVNKAYGKWKDGLKFYDDVYKSEKNPFLLQQCSLFLLKRKRYHEAALKIDKALQISRKRFFSIENTHAIVLFKANVNSSSDSEAIRSTLDKSMSILQACYKDDLRKSYHSITFAEQALEYFAKYPDGKGLEYLQLALKWLKEISVERKYHGKARRLKREIESVL